MFMLLVDALLELCEVIFGVVDGQQAAEGIFQDQQPEERVVGSTQLMTKDGWMLYIQSLYKKVSEFKRQNASAYPTSAAASPLLCVRAVTQVDASND